MIELQLVQVFEFYNLFPDNVQNIDPWTSARQPKPWHAGPA